MGIEDQGPDSTIGSTDMGNVSWAWREFRGG
jgi:hypothetical protein